MWKKRTNLRKASVVVVLAFVSARVNIVLDVLFKEQFAQNEGRIIT